MKQFKMGLITSLVVLAMGTVAGCGSQQKASESSAVSSKRVTKTSHKAKKKATKASVKSSSASSSSASTSQQSNARSSSRARSAATASSKQAATKKMNFAQIQAGDYTSLLGSWTEVAEAANYHKGNGTTWGPVATPNPLTITARELKNESMTMTANSITSNGETSAVGYRHDGDVFWADTRSGAIIWNIAFYPVGVAITGDFQGTNLPSSLSTRKERIMIRTSNNDFTEVFMRN
ncbi:MAG: DUF2262 domain-containing protein [Lacticaseibacillus songhuajiangensis]|jgi:hypothetical protein|nr:DUF2262 domain-containing protein [Lacticaseibacillus songhuajiangensis]